MTCRDLHSFLSPKILHLIVMPTEQCNFRCVYCYEDFALGKMDPNTVRGVKAFLSRRAPELELLSLEWFGGEPLLALNLVEEIQAHAQSLRQSYPGLHLLGSMTTNASLLDGDRLGRLARLGIRSYQISLDGPRELHDRRRLTRGEKGTFDTIWRNLIGALLVAEDFEIVLRIHVNRENRDSLPGFLEECHAAFGQDPRFKISLRALRRLGGPRDSSLPTFDSRRQENEALAKLERHAARIGMPIHSAPFKGKNPLAGCYAAAGNSFVVRSNGDVAKCTVALAHPENRVGRLYGDGSVKLDDDKMAGWLRGVFSGDEQALRCPMVGLADRSPSPRERRLPVLGPLSRPAPDGPASLDSSYFP